MLGSAAQAVEDVIATIRHFLLLAMNNEASSYNDVRDIGRWGKSISDQHNLSAIK